MTLFLACNDAFRNCTPPEEYFDFGLWFPPDEFARKQLDAKGGKGIGAPLPGEAVEKKKAAPPPPPEKINEEKKAFEQKFGGKPATVAQAADFAREKGFAPSQADLQKLQEKKKELTFDELQAFLKEISHPEDTDDYLVQFFRSYDTQNSGTLSRKQVTNLLMNFGEPLSADEADGILKKFDFTSDPVDYIAFAKKLLEA